MSNQWASVIGGHGDGLVLTSIFLEATVLPVPGGDGVLVGTTVLTGDGVTVTTSVGSGDGTGVDV